MPKKHLSVVEMELIIRGTAKVNPINDHYGEGPLECIFCHGTQGFGPLRHATDCAWVAANEFVNRLDNKSN